MSDRPELLDPESNTSVDFSLDKSDLIKIKQVELEKKLYALCAQRESELKKAQKNAKDKWDLLQALLKSKEEDKTFVSEVVNSLKNVGINGIEISVIVDIKNISPGQSKELSDGTVLKGPKSEEEDVAYILESYALKSCLEASYADVDISHHRSLSPEENGLYEDYRRAVVAEQSAENRLREVKKEISNIPALIREAEAEFAKKVLESTSDGKFMLQSISGITSHLLEE